MAQDEQEKTYQPTTEKIRKAREEGNVPKSQEINSFSVLLIGTIYIVFNFSFISEHITKIFRYSLNFNFILNNKFEETYTSMMDFYLVEIGYILLPLVFLIFISAIVANLSQFGFLLNPLKIDTKKLNIINGFKQLFSKKKFIDFNKMLLKLIILIGILLLILYTKKDTLRNMELMSLGDSFSYFFKIILYILFVALTIIGIFAILDMVVVRMDYTKKQMMSFQEIKDEYKNTEGNPEVKQKIKQLQRQAAQRQSINEAADAKVIITNPDHYAIAIGQKINEEEGIFEDPIILAKGKNKVALQIKQIGYENNIEIIENKPLARALFANTEVGQTIPEEFMRLVFDILVEMDYVKQYLDKKNKLNIGY